MKKFEVTIVRKQKWTYVIETDDEDDAKAEAESLSYDEPARDDWGLQHRSARTEVSDVR